MSREAFLYSSTASVSIPRCERHSGSTLCAGRWRRVGIKWIPGIGERPDRARDYDLLLLPWRFARLRNRLMRVLTTICVWRLRPDILFTRSPLLGLPGLWRGVQVVLELHSLPDEGSKTRIALQRSLRHPRLRRIVTISQALADDLVAEYGPPHPGCDIVVAHDGAVAGPRPGPAAAHDGPLRVGYFGHLYPGKGMETIAALAPLLPGLRFEVHGGTEPTSPAGAPPVPGRTT